MVLYLVGQACMAELSDALAFVFGCSCCGSYWALLGSQSIASPGAAWERLQYFQMKKSLNCIKLYKRVGLSIVTCLLHKSE